jgi:hypothetical protein
MIWGNSKRTVKNKEKMKKKEKNPPTRTKDRVFEPRLKIAISNPGFLLLVGKPKL